MNQAVAEHGRKADRTDPDTAGLISAYRNVRLATESLCQPLETDDYTVQTMADVSPAKWHIAHVSWFFETFLLKPCLAGYREYHPHFARLFNSYYNSVGSPFPRGDRGHLNRPTVREVYRYRAHVDQHMYELLARPTAAAQADIQHRTVIGLHHEQQHQELLLTDIKHVYATNPLRPAYQDKAPPATAVAPDLQWHTHPGGLLNCGHEGSGFCYDNELPVHQQYLAPFRLASRLVTNGEYLDFIEDDGYGRSDLWLSDAWKTVRQQQWRAPLYWEKLDGQWWHMTLNGMQAVDRQAPVCHVSFYEADAYARWAGKRLPLEAEWEVVEGNLGGNGILHPVAAGGEEPAQLYGDTWEWTQSPYRPYPGYKPLDGALGEYNGKFMCNQFVLRGGSCVTPDNHIRSTYRNFFYPGDRWQFSGFRLADDG